MQDLFSPHAPRSSLLLSLSLSLLGRAHTHTHTHTHTQTDYKYNYWKVRNSWNTDWGENGFIYVSMGYNTCGIATEPTTVTMA
jgi:aminopeptidase C